jgi:lipopolysaccharide cholinephosphotransferase
MVELNINIPKGFLEEEVKCGHTVTQKMKEIWAVELDLLAEFQRVCEKYHLKYYASGGTLLGAVRHQGFIPWDDDIDIEMFRDDYIKLCEIGPKEFKKPYVFQNEYTESGSLRGFSKLRNSRTTAMYPHEQRECYCGYDKGIFIDIFPLDSILDNPTEQSKKKKKADRWCKAYLSSIDIYYHRQQNKNSIIGKTKELLRPILYYPSKWSKTWLHRKYEEACSIGDEIPTEKVAIYCIYNQRTIHQREDFEDSVMMDFEFMKISAPIHYDQNLTNAFGNWHEFVKGGSLHGENALIFDTDTAFTSSTK